MNRLALISSLSTIHQGLGQEAHEIAEVEKRVKCQEAQPEDLARIAAGCRYGLLQHQNAVLAMLSYLEQLPCRADMPSKRHR